MKVIRKLQQLDELGLSAHSRQALMQRLIEPFDFDINAAQSMWEEIDTALIYIEASDSDASLCQEDEASQSLMDFVKECPEFVDTVITEASGDDNGEVFLLALAIFTDDGGGCYLFAPLSSQTQIVSELTTQLLNPEG